MPRRIEWDIVVIGGANTDYVIRGPRLPAPSETVRGETFRQAPGGKGANQALAAARLGARSALVARLGRDDRAHEIVTRLERERVNTHHLTHDHAAPTGIALIMVDRHGEKQILTLPGANYQFNLDDVYAAAGMISSCRVLIMQLEVPLKCLMAAAHIAREAGVMIVLNPSPPIALPDELLRLTDVIRINAREATVLTGEQVHDRDSARRAAELLLERGVGAVAIQAGQDGNLILWPHHEAWLPKLPVSTVDTTGAGAAFSAALAVALAEGRSLEEAGPFANAAAALATTKLGAQAGLPQRRAVQALMDHVHAEHFDWNNS
ncbi:MAG TPA: ribokinase [Gammaproteobacteria bacterium]|nr:ribokinase [Gammaproteobacteria bacterium]